MTSLYKGRSVSKDHLRIEVCGTLDELCSYLGLARCQSKNNKLKKIIESIQKDLFVIGTEVASEPRFIKNIKERIDKPDIARLENHIKNLERKKIVKKPCFHLPGKNMMSSILDISRAITRRAERGAVKLSRKKFIKNDFVLIYLNRLSDLLYLLARKAGKNRK